MEKTVRPYEVMVRLGRGGVETAHVIEIEEIVEDGKVTFARERPARPLALADKEFSTVVAAIDATVLGERDSLKASLDAATKENLELSGGLAELNDRFTQMANAHTSLQAESADREKEVAARNVRITHLEGECAAMEQQVAELTAKVSDLERQLADQAREMVADDL